VDYDYGILILGNTYASSIMQVTYASQLCHLRVRAARKQICLGPTTKPNGQTYLDAKTSFNVLHNKHDVTR
jgi:hypothetical protein